LPETVSMIVPILPPAEQFLREEVIRAGMDLMYFANSRHLRGADEKLEELGLGRAHHRAIHFIGRRPDITVGELLTILGVTKQSFGRVAKQLMARGLVEQRPGVADRRQRLMRLTERGVAFERQIFDEMHDNVARAYAAAGGAAVAGYWTVLQHLMGAEASEQFSRLYGRTLAG
jgi:DNA-binding MarR family transcriptional regulator